MLLSISIRLQCAGKTLRVLTAYLGLRFFLPRKRDIFRVVVLITAVYVYFAMLRVYKQGCL